MKIVSWNVNGYRSIWKKNFEDSILQMNPDILWFQENYNVSSDTIYIASSGLPVLVYYSDASYRIINMPAMTGKGVDVVYTKEVDTSKTQWRNEFYEYGDYSLSGHPFGTESGKIVAWGKKKGTGNYNYNYPSECWSNATLLAAYKGWVTSKTQLASNATIVEDVYWEYGRSGVDNWWDVNCSNGPITFWKSVWGTPAYWPTVMNNTYAYSQLKCTLDRKIITSGEMSNRYGDALGWEIIDGTE